MLLLSPKLQSDPGAESSCSKGFAGPGLSSCLDLGPCLKRVVVCKHPLCGRPLRKPSYHGHFLHLSFQDGEMWTPCAVRRVTNHRVLSESSPGQTITVVHPLCHSNWVSPNSPLTFFPALGDRSPVSTSCCLVRVHVPPTQ